MQYERSYVLPQIAGIQASQRRENERITVIKLSKGVPFDNSPPTEFLHFRGKKNSSDTHSKSSNALEFQAVLLYDLKMRKAVKKYTF